MRRSILPVLLLLAIVTLTLSDVLPVISVNEAETIPINDDQVYDNTFNAIDNRERGVFYEFLVRSPKTERDGKPGLKYSGKNIDKSDSNELINEEDNYDDKGFRKEQWHNYPRQLDRLHKTPLQYRRNGNANLEFENSRLLKRMKDSDIIDIGEKSGDDIIDNSNDIEEVAVPLLIFKIRLAFLKDNLQDSGKFEYTNSVPVTHDNSKFNKQEVNIMDTTDDNNNDRHRKIREKDMTYEHDFDGKKTVNKRIFSLWSRLHGISHKGHELQHRRHLYAYYGLPDDGSNTLTAETRATLIRPPGSPLRWG